MGMRRPDEPAVEPAKPADRQQHRRTYREIQRTVISRDADRHVFAGDVDKAAGRSVMRLDDDVAEIAQQMTHAITGEFAVVSGIAVIREQKRVDAQQLAARLQDTPHFGNNRMGIGTCSITLSRMA